MQRNGRGNEARTHSFDSGRESYDVSFTRIHALKERKIDADVQNVSGKDYYNGNGDHDAHKTKGMNVQVIRIIGCFSHLILS